MRWERNTWPNTSEVPRKDVNWGHSLGDVPTTGEGEMVRMGWDYHVNSWDLQNHEKYPQTCHTGDFMVIWCDMSNPQSMVWGHGILPANYGAPHLVTAGILSPRGELTRRIVPKPTADRRGFSSKPRLTTRGYKQLQRFFLVCYLRMGDTDLAAQWFFVILGHWMNRWRDWGTLFSDPDLPNAKLGDFTHRRAK